MEIGARLDAHEADLQIRIDSHELWVHHADDSLHAMHGTLP